jgi:hypothetical protein
MAKDASGESAANGSNRAPSAQSVTLATAPPLLWLTRPLASRVARGASGSQGRLRLGPSLESREPDTA